MCVERRDVNGSLDIFDEKTDATVKVEEKRKGKEKERETATADFRLAAPTRALGPHVFLASQCFPLSVPVLGWYLTVHRTAEACPGRQSPGAREESRRLPGWCPAAPRTSPPWPAHPTLGL